MTRCIVFAGTVVATLMTLACLGSAQKSEGMGDQMRDSAGNRDRFSGSGHSGSSSSIGGGSSVSSGGGGGGGGKLSGHSLEYSPSGYGFGNGSNVNAGNPSYGFGTRGSNHLAPFGGNHQDRPDTYGGGGHPYFQSVYDMAGTSENPATQAIRKDLLDYYRRTGRVGGFGDHMAAYGSHWGVHGSSYFADALDTYQNVLAGGLYELDPLGLREDTTWYKAAPGNCVAPDSNSKYEGDVPDL